MDFHPCVPQVGGIPVNRGKDKSFRLLKIMDGFKSKLVAMVIAIVMYLGRHGPECTGAQIDHLYFEITGLMADHIPVGKFGMSAAFKV